MPWTAKQFTLAQAILHGWKPKSKNLEGFGPDFARQVVAEGVKGKRKRKRKK